MDADRAAADKFTLTDGADALRLSSSGIELSDIGGKVRPEPTSPSVLSKAWDVRIEDAALRIISRPLASPAPHPPRTGQNTALLAKVSGR